MKKQITENPAEADSAKLNAIASNIVEEQAQLIQNVTIAKRISKGQPMKSAAALGPDYSVDKRKEVRKEHTNHFTNRAPAKSK